MTVAALDSLFGSHQTAWLTLVCLLAAAFARPVIRAWRDDAGTFVGVGFDAHRRRPALAWADHRRSPRGPPVPPPLRPVRPAVRPS